METDDPWGRVVREVDAVASPHAPAASKEGDVSQVRYRPWLYWLVRVIYLSMSPIDNLRFRLDIWFLRQGSARAAARRRRDRDERV